MLFAGSMVVYAVGIGRRIMELRKTVFQCSLRTLRAEVRGATAATE
jgi:hypothetical protein